MGSKLPITVMTLLLLAALSGCSAASEPGSSPQLTSDAGGEGQDSAPASDTPRTDTASDTAEAEVSGVEDISSLDTVEPGPNPADLEALCTAYCAKLSECGQPFGGTDDCPKQCAEKVLDDEGWANSYACAALSECQQLSGCTASPIPTHETCTETCKAGDACSLFPSVLLGQNIDACELRCSIQMKFNGIPYGKFLDCVSGVLESGCSDVEVLECNPSFNNQLCAALCVGQSEGTTCGQAPAPFDSVDTCKTECETWTTAQTWIARFCATRFECDEPGVAVCFPPATEAAAGATAFCEGAWGLCGGQEGYSIPKDPEVCSWMLTGFHTAQALSFQTATECLDSLPSCPEDPNATFGCLTPPYPPCADFCAKLQSCGAPGDLSLCEIQCNGGHASGLEGLDATIECVLDNACPAVGACFDSPGGDGGNSE